MSEGKLRIAVLGTRGIPDVMGGVETHCQELYPRLVARGHHVTLFGRTPYLNSVTTYEYSGINVVPLWAPRKKSLEAILQTFIGVLHVARNRDKFDLLHVHAIGPALLIPLAKLLGIPVVMTHHGPDYDRQKWGRIAKFVLRTGESMGCRFADAVITVSRHIASLVDSRFSNKAATYIPNGVNLPDILPPSEILARYQIRPQKYILTVGRFVPEKGFHDLLQAFSACKTDWKLVIAGDADHEDEYSRNLKQMAKEDSRVVLTGFIRGKELGEIFSNSALFVLPSYHEGLPIALLEAISYNLPILASNIPANSELVTENESFPVGDIIELKRKIEILIELNAHQAEAYPRLNSEFNWEIITKQTEDIYFSITNIDKKIRKMN